MLYGSIKYPFIFLELEFPLILNSSAICAMFILLIELDVAEFLVYVDSYFFGTAPNGQALYGQNRIYII